VATGLASHTRKIKHKTILVWSMANADTLTSSLPELTPGSVAEEVPVARDISPEDIPAPASPPHLPVVDADPVPIPLAEPNPIAPVRSSLVPLGSQAVAASAAPPQPKRFSAVNINKKFLEKNSSSSSTSAPTSANSTTSKAGGPVRAFQYILYEISVPIHFVQRDHRCNRRPPIRVWSRRSSPPPPKRYHQLVPAGLVLRLLPLLRLPPPRSMAQPYPRQVPAIRQRVTDPNI
jgi:hypothetical protein